MRIEFIRAAGGGPQGAAGPSGASGNSGSEGDVVGLARWDGRRAAVEAEDAGVRTALERIFRLAPVVVVDPSLTSPPAQGASLVQPGGLEWFREAALTRAVAEGLRARIVPEAQPRSGWDPASAYRTFRDAVEIMVEGGSRT